MLPGAVPELVVVGVEDLAVAAGLDRRVRPQRVPELRPEQTVHETLKGALATGRGGQARDGLVDVRA